MALNYAGAHAAQEAASPNSHGFPDLEDVRRDYRLLDRAEIPLPPGIRLVGVGDSPTRRSGGFTQVEWIEPGRLISACRRLPFLGNLLYALKVLTRAGHKSVILCETDEQTEKLMCMVNAVWPKRRAILSWETFLSGGSPLKRFLGRLQLGGTTIAAMYSRRLIALVSQELGISQDKFLVIPYKSNHSRHPPLTMAIGRYVFSGGNSKRDYKTLFEAVKGSDIPVIISATMDHATRGLEVPSNVVVVSAREPAFSRLMAGSLFVVIPIQPGSVHGAGEGSVCDAMWHGKPVIAANDTSLSDYIEEGVSGYTVAPGDVKGLRARIIDLWSDPDRVKVMGKAAHARVRDSFTKDHFAYRIQQLAYLLAWRIHGTEAS